MFHIGDKVVYPMQGAGIIEAIEEKEILGEKHSYFVMHVNNMKVMFPMIKSDRIGIRHIAKSDALSELQEIFHQEDTNSHLNPSQRHRKNMDKMKSGVMHDSAEVYRDLMRVSLQKTLGVGDKILLEKARDMLAGELALIKGIDENQAVDLLADIIVNC